MTTGISDVDELRVTIERLRALLENLIVRGLRACGPDELAQLRAFTEYLDRAGAGHVGSVLTRLNEQIERDDRASARTMLEAQVAVRLLERLLTLKVVRGQYDLAIALMESQRTDIPVDDTANEQDENTDDDVDEQES